MLLILVLWVGTVFGEDVSRSADLLLDDVRAYLRASDLTYVRLPGFSHLGFTCNKGRFGDISSLYRAGAVEVINDQVYQYQSSPITLINDDNRAEFRGKFGLQLVSIGYTSCTFVHLFNQDFHLNLPNPTLDIGVVIERNGTKCFGRLEKVNLSYEDRIRFNSDIWLLNWVEKLIVELVLFFYKNRLIIQLETEINEYASKYNQGYQCSD